MLKSIPFLVRLDYENTKKGGYLIASDGTNGHSLNPVNRQALGELINFLTATYNELTDSDLKEIEENSWREKEAYMERVEKELREQKKIRIGKKGCVYFLSDCAGNIKIGCTKYNTPEKRIQSMRTMPNVDIKVIGYFESDDILGEEKELHQLFADTRIKGEWFNISDNQAIKILIQKGGIYYGE